MTSKMYLGIAALIVFMIAAGGFIYWNVSTVQQMKKQAALFEKMLEKEKEPVVANEPPPAAPGRKWVPHGDHFHEVPIDAPDVWQGEPHEPVVPQKQHTVDASGKVIYPHQELLDTHPVKALRAQAKDAGHWSAKYIPPFPADDVEANEFARNVYIRNYYKSIGDPYHPNANNARNAISELEIDSGIYVKTGGNRVSLNLFPSPRQWDLVRLSLTGHDDPPFDAADRTTWLGTDMINWVMDSTFTGEEYLDAYNNQ